MKIRGNTVGTTTPRPDYAQDNERKADHIKNRPVPLPKEKDEGKVLRVVGGKWVPDSNVATLDESGKIASELLQLDATLSDTSENPVMNRVVKAALVAMGSGTKLATGSYTGAGKWGADNPNTITLPFVPDIVMVWSRQPYPVLLILTPNHGTTLVSMGGTQQTYFDYSIVTSFSGTTVSWYVSADKLGLPDVAQGNDSRGVYYYYALGRESYTAWDGGDY